MNVQAKSLPEGGRQIHLTMDEKTAEVLLEVLNHVGGDPCGKAPRARMDKLRQALMGLGVQRSRCSHSGTVTVDPS
jgi:hypothetical protein